MADRQMYEYSAYGLKIHSELPVPEFPLTPSQIPDIRVVLRPGEWETNERDDRGFPHYRWTNPHDLTYLAPGIVRFRIRNGSDIEVTPSADPDPRYAELSLAGPVMAAILYQRGRLVLHGSSVLIDGRVAAFIGNRGQGKSTMAAALHVQGCPFITDDITALDPRTGELFPGYPQVKIDPRMAARFGWNAGSLTPVHVSSPKVIYRSLHSRQHTPLPLAAVYSLEDAEEVSFQRLSLRDAVMELTTQSYRFDEACEGVAPGRYLEHCARVATKTPVFRLRRPRDPSCLREVARRVSEHLSSVHTEPAEGNSG